jgi:putative transposase
MDENPRKLMKRHEVLDGMRFLTFSCYQNLPLLGNPAIRDLFAEHLGQACIRKTLRVRAWVAMPDHVHLLVCPARGEATLVNALWSLKRDFARAVVGRWRKLDAPVLNSVRAPDGRYRFWQRRGGYDRNIWSAEELYEKLRYIHKNPVRCELVNEPAEWPWSSARWYAGDHSGPVPVDEGNPRV